MVSEGVPSRKRRGCSEFVKVYCLNEVPGAMSACLEWYCSSATSGMSPVGFKWYR